MASLTILNASGDTTVTWSLRAFADGDGEAVAAVAEAERLFAEARALGAEAFLVRQGDVAQRVTTLDPARDEDIVLVPHMVGG
jgi:hypothetical protein